jgi:hypothetical protein
LAVAEAAKQQSKIEEREAQEAEAGANQQRGNKLWFPFTAPYSLSGAPASLPGHFYLLWLGSQLHFLDAR